ncbi:MAG: murein transglycosylase domain-containing protein [Gammaproteobacteria bacterium]
MLLSQHNNLILECPLQDLAPKLCFVFLSLLYSQMSFSSAPLLASNSSFESYKQNTEREFAQAKDQFRLYKQQLLAAFDEYQFKTDQVWGRQHRARPNKKTWISYQGDLNHRSIVDFENGVVRVEVAIDKDRKIGKPQAIRDLEHSILTTMNLGQDKRSILKLAKQPVAKPSGPAVLSKLIADDRGQPLSKSDYKTQAANLAARARSSTIKGEDGKSRLLYSAQFRLVPDHIRKRAKQFQPTVNKYAAEQKVPAELVFAIIETESMFNPVARSAVPAFGLMQLVPSAGALEAYRYLYNKNKIVTDQYLYNPSNNIRLGAAYLNQLYYKYMKDIKDPKARLWASIAAYNTGPSNVFRTFAGKYSRSRHGNWGRWKASALGAINRMSSAQVFDFMYRNLPYRETRHYIKNVRSRMNKYQAI